MSVYLYSDGGAECLVEPLCLRSLVEFGLVRVFENFAPLELAATGMVLFALVAADHRRRSGRLRLLQALSDAHFRVLRLRLQLRNLLLWVARVCALPFMIARQVKLVIVSDGFQVGLFFVLEHVTEHVGAIPDLHLQLGALSLPAVLLGSDLSRRSVIKQLSAGLRQTYLLPFDRRADLDAGVLHESVVRLVLLYLSN